MLTGERRPVSGRRGMTVLGKIPAVPKPINLPSQRLENRGLDPNVEIVPRGSVSWGAAGRSPPAGTGTWANSSQSTSPPVSGPWGGAPPRPATAGSSGSATGSSGPWGGNAPRPSSAGSGTRPSSAGSLRQTQETVAAANAWGPAMARPSSASGVLGQAQSQPPADRPRSAETRTLSVQAPALTRFAEQSSGSALPQSPAWGGAGAARKLGEEPHQPARFTLTRGDFPTLGSEKNPDLRPQQQNKTGSSPPERTVTVDERPPPAEERPPSGPAGPYEELPPTSAGTFGGQERMPEGWRRDGRPYGGHPGMAEGSWHRESPPPMQPYGGGQPQVSDTWRRESGHGAAPGGGPSDDNWRRGGPPVGPYGPPGPGRFQPDPAVFMHQQRYGPGPGPYGRGGGPGPGGYGRHGDMYGNAAQFGRPGGVAPPRPGPPMGPGMYQGPVPYDNYYGPPGPGYGNMDDREMMMLGMNGPPAMYGNYPQGPPVEPFGRYPHGGPGPGPRHGPNNSSRERIEPMGYEGDGYREGTKYKDNANFKDGGGYKDGGGFNKEGSRLAPYPDQGEGRRGGHSISSSLTNEMQRPSSRGGHQVGHRDWGAAASSDEPMDFSKPVFEEDVSSASPGPIRKHVPSTTGVDSDSIQIEGERKPEEQIKSLDLTVNVGLPGDNVKGLIASSEAKESPLTNNSKSDDLSKDGHVQSWKQKEVDSGVPSLKSKGDDISVPETKDHLVRKVQSLEISEPSEKRWVKDGRLLAQSTRDRGFGREPVFSPHGGRGVGVKKESNPSSSTVTMPGVPAGRPGSFTSTGGVNNRSAVGIPQNPVPLAPESGTPDEVVVHEKHTLSNSQPSTPASPSGSDSQKSSDKVRILKRVGDGPESPPSDNVNTPEALHAEVLVVAVSAIEPSARDDAKSKTKPVNTHDTEKEWRPKVPPPDTAIEVQRTSSTAGPKQATALPASTGAGMAATVTTEKTVEVVNPSSGESYDYEAQRAKMKESAAQRAIQLRKEEEERIKEQKAKAMAKLEELNRRSLIVPISQLAESPAVDEAVDEPAIVAVLPEEPEIVSLEVVVEELQVIENISSGTGVSTPRGGVRNGRNEHGKRERVGDRKSNGRSREEHRVKMGSGEHRELAKGRLSSSLSNSKMDPPLLPPPSQQLTGPPPVLPSPSTGHGSNVLESSTVVSLETSSSVGSNVQHLVTPKLQDGRHRGKQHVSQQKQVGRASNSSLDSEQPASVQEPAADIPDKFGGWSVGISAPLDFDAKDVTLSLGTNVANNESASAARKRKTKNSARNKQKLEGLTVSTDSASSVEPNQGWSIDLPVSNDLETDLVRTGAQALVQSGGDDVIKVVPVLPSHKEQAPLDSKSELLHGEPPVLESAGDVAQFRSNGDLPSKRPQRKSQPPRRLPARDRGISQDVRVGDKPHGGEGMIWAPVKSPSGGHPAGPKGGFGSDSMVTVETAPEKKEEVVVPPQTGRARRAELERYTPKPVVKQQAQHQEELHQQQVAPTVAQNQGNESSSTSAASEVLQNSLTEIKFGSEARQVESSSKQGRTHASWRQRGPGNDRMTSPKETVPVPHSESPETGFKSQQPSNNSQAQQSYHRNKSIPNMASEQSRPGSSHQSRSDSGQLSRHQALAEKEQHAPESTLQGRSSNSSLSGPAMVVVEKEQKIPQESIAPYQPPRAASSQKNREGDVQGSNEHVRPHRAHTSQADRQHGGHGKFDRDHHSTQDRGLVHPQSRSHNSRSQGLPGSHDRDGPIAHSGSHQQSRPASAVQASLSEGAMHTREKEQQNSYQFGVGQTKPSSQSLHGQHLAPVSTEREQSHGEHRGSNQPAKSPVRQRPRQQAIAHERDQTNAGSHTHQQSRYRHPVHERDHQREVPNAVQHHQQSRNASDGHWQQSGGVAPDRSHTNSDVGLSYERSSSHKSQAITQSMDRDHAPAHTGPHQLSRSDSQTKAIPPPNDSQKQQQYQPVAHNQKPQLQLGSQGQKLDAPHNTSHWNGERGGNSPTFRGREHGHSRRGRFGGRSAGAGPGRSGEMESRRDQLPKQRLTVDPAGGAVPSQVGG